MSVTGCRQPSEDKSGRAGPLWGGARCRPGEPTVSGTRGNGGGGQSLKRKKTFLLSTRALDLYQKPESELKGTLNLGRSQPPHLTSVVSPRSHGQELDRARAGLAARHPPPPCGTFLLIVTILSVSVALEKQTRKELLHFRG